LHPTHQKTLQRLAAGLLLATASLAHAQYVWKDEKGLKVFSDQPPPPSVPFNQILKVPHAVSSQSQSGGDGNGTISSISPADGSKGQPSIAEQEAAYRKRKADAAIAEQKAAVAAQQRSLVAANCANARQEQATMASGDRVSTVDSNGERAYLSDDERTAKLNQARRALANCQ
jgi:hypothetical protein